MNSTKTKLINTLVAALSGALCLGFAAPVALGGALDELQNAYKAHCGNADSQRDEQLKKLDASYVGALERQLDKVKATGKLEAAIPFNDEIKAVKKGDDPLPPLAANAASELKNMRGTYLDSRDKILKDHAASIVALTDKMEKELKSQEVALTKEGKLDDALAAKRMREALAGDAATIAARDLVKYSGQRGNGSPACQIRRCGDNLEVIVFRDRRGKISMDSPVENVREKTGAKKELGNTKAKVLGEFVGAKGYQADAYIAYHHVFDGKDLGKLSLGQLDAVPKHSEAGEKGLRLSFDPLAVNPSGNFGEILPPNTGKGTYRITCHYFIPKGNQALIGFEFVHGGGGAIGGQVFDKTGKWETAELTAESPNATTAMLLYLCLAQGKKVIDAVNDYVVLGEVKVEYLKFSAFVQQKFGAHGEPLEAIDDPKKQELFISNGEFAQK